MEYLLDIKVVCSVLSVIIGIGAFFPYLRDVFLKKTKPHAYTWLIWTITQGTAVAGLWYGNGGLGSIALTIGTFFVFVVFLASLKLGTRNITREDTLVLMLALGAVVVWWQFNNPLLAVIMVTLIDALGYIPSFRKSVTDPWDETVLSWFMFALANVFAIIALSQYNSLTLPYITMQIVANVSLGILCLIRRQSIPKK